MTFTEPLQLAFIFDATILEKLPGYQPGACLSDRRVAFIHSAVSEISERLSASDAHLIVRYGDPATVIAELAQSLAAVRVIFAHDDEPQARQRDGFVRSLLAETGIDCISVKDQCIFERDEVLTAAGRPFSVFTPYKNAWLKRLEERDLAPYACKAKAGQFAAIPKKLDMGIPSLDSMGFCATGIESYLPPGSDGGQSFLEDFLQRIDHYQIGRDFPAIKGVSYLSTHLRFGMLSIRGLVREAHRRMLAGSMGATIWLSELIWRDFYFMILANHPRLASGAAFKPDYDDIVWESGATAKKRFAAWCDGRTGYPLVDAAMHQLNQSGYMHNRLRMIVASFLTKDLGIDWRWGEAYFAKHLNDFEFSSNNGGWQWASSSGCDAQPYFRIFNPTTQSQRFDPQGKFIRRYIPALEKLSDKSIHAPWEAGHIELEAAGILLGRDYPLPIVNHDEARKETLVRYSVVKKVSAPD